MILVNLLGLPSSEASGRKAASAGDCQILAGRQATENHSVALHLGTCLGIIKDDGNGLRVHVSYVLRLLVKKLLTAAGISGLKCNFLRFCPSGAFSCNWKIRIERTEATGILVHIGFPFRSGIWWISLHGVLRLLVERLSVGDPISTKISDLKWCSF